LSRRLSCVPGPGVSAAELTGGMPGSRLTGMARVCAPTRGA
jgi:hypothetical protein